MEWWQLLFVIVVSAISLSMVSAVVFSGIANVYKTKAVIEYGMKAELLKKFEKNEQETSAA